MSAHRQLQQIGVDKGGHLLDRQAAVDGELGELVGRHARAAIGLAVAQEPVDVADQIDVVAGAEEAREVR